MDAPPARTSTRCTEVVLIDDAVALAREMLTKSLAGESKSEAHRRRRLGRLLADAHGRQFIFELTDEVLRLENPRLAAARFAEVVDRHRTKAVGRIDLLLLRVGAALATRLPRVVMPLVVRRIKSETDGVVIPADDPKFSKHLRQRAVDGVQLNVSPLGEAILSDAEADERMAIVVDQIERLDVDYVSVKVSSIVANLDTLAFELSLDRICSRIRELYRCAEASNPRTFVNLDMEEYRDLELTLQAFMRVLDEPEFGSINAGIVLQAYLPDSHDALKRLSVWAIGRHAQHGGTVKVRLVKGANLAMEAIEAELSGWVSAPYGSKAEVDASYKAMLESGLTHECGAALRIGVASHNLFDIAWAWTLGSKLGVLDRIDFEMLEGMAPAQARVVGARAGHLVMYAPVVSPDDFGASIAYLARRLDENTQPDNFLRSLFTLTPNSPEFEAEAERFAASVRARHDVFRGRRRTAMDMVRTGGFQNEPDSDMTVPEVRQALLRAVADPPQVSFRRIEQPEQIEIVLKRATEAHMAGEHSRQTRQKWLRDVADQMSAERAETIALMARDVAKTIHEGDPEVSEAIDFCRYYGTAGSEALDRAQNEGLEVVGRGVVVVIGPWNFPYAIPTGGVAAAIAAGNSVILKPASSAAAVGALIAEQFWRAGVPRDIVQLAVFEDGPLGRHLVSSTAVDTVVLTGGYDTAAKFLDWRPGLRLIAETSGKDALIITPSADMDQAIADLVHSAFSHAGQKCSAASLGIVVAEVYDDSKFRQRLHDAVASLRVGAADDPASMVGPLIAPPTGKLLRGLTCLDQGESWLVEPRLLDTPGTAPGTSWMPGVRLDVLAGSWFHRTECFGPVLGLMRADDLEHAIELQNAGDYGLTGGIHSLDEVEVELWLTKVELGNAYVNRPITGAIVQRQPFGGWKRSSVGGGAKAGGPGYVAQFARISDSSVAPTDVGHTTTRFESTWKEYFCKDHDEAGLRSEANVLRYLPLSRIEVRHRLDNSVGLEILQIAAEVTGIALGTSTPADESDLDFAVRLTTADVQPDRVRLFGSLDSDARHLLHKHNIAIDVDVPVNDPMIELQRWVREQAISTTLHRHGRIDDGH